MDYKYKSAYRYIDPAKLIDSKTINQDESMEAGARSGLETSAVLKPLQKSARKRAEYLAGLSV